MQTLIQVNYDNRLVNGIGLTMFKDAVVSEFHPRSYTITPHRVVLFFDHDVTPKQMGRLAILSSENGLGSVQRIPQ